MARYGALANGNFGTAATWGTVTNTPGVHATTNITVTSSNFFTGTFTAPGLLNHCQGMYFYLNTAVTGGLVVTLQENTVDTAATVTVTLTGLGAGTWYFAKFPTPYLFTTLTGNSYRFRLTRSGANSVVVAADSGAANPAYYALDDRAVVPTTGDDWAIVSDGSAAIAVTLDGTQSTGSGTDTTLPTNMRSVGFGGMICSAGKLTADTTATSQITSKGTIVVGALGELNIGSVASPLSASYTCTIIFDQAVNGNHGLVVLDTKSGKFIAQGTPKSSTSLWKAKLSSGVGTAADPAILDASVDWSVGDEVVIGATSDNATNYNETESRFIITKNSATSYVWSATSGGAEAALTFTHSSSAWVVNVQRNIVIKGTSTSLNAFVSIVDQTNSTDVNIDWVRFENIGLTGSGTKTGVNIGDGVALDYSILYKPGRTGFHIATVTTAKTFTGLVSLLGTSTVGALGDGFHVASAKKLNFVDCFSFGQSATSWQITDTFGCMFTRCYGIASTSAASGYGFNITTSGNLTLTDCEAHANRTAGMLLNATVQTAVNNPVLGTKGKNGSRDVEITVSTFLDFTFTNGLFGSTTPITTQYLQMLDGSELRFHKYQQTENNHIWYTNAGIARSTGSGLTDTTIRTTGSLGLRIAPEDLTNGFFWEFLIPAVGNTNVSFQGFFQKNAAFGTDVCTVELFLPGSSTADASYNLTNTTGSWQSAVVSAFYSSSVSSLARVRVTAYTATASAYIYVDDLYNAGDTTTSYDKLPGLDIWYNGKPAEIISPLFLGGIAPQVWSVGTAGLINSPGTTGFVLSSLITRTGTAQAGGANTITLDASANSNNDFYLDDYIVIVGGTGAGQCRRISSYNGTTKVATCIRTWSTTPDSTSVFSIIPFFSIENAVWEALAASHTTAGSFGKSVTTIKNTTEDTLGLIVAG